jgi:hypothetical protein
VQIVRAYLLAGSGTMSVNAGSSGNGVQTGNTNGAGGSGGGFFGLTTHASCVRNSSFSTTCGSINITATGGNAGIGHGTGGNGVAGSPGNVVVNYQ